MFKIETHLHTASVSRCGKMSAEQIVDLYVNNGYYGVIVTDHFFHGNCRINDEMPDAPFADRVHAFARGYREVKEAAGDRLKVFFGFEQGFPGTHILVYGWDEDKLAALPEIMDLSARQFLQFAKENGALAVHAHPYRESPDLDHFNLYPEAEAVEIINASRGNRENALANSYVGAFGMIPTAGSDMHRRSQAIIGGLSFEHPIDSMEEFIDAVRKREGTPFSQPNVVSVRENFYLD
ncbi:MAG: hypothetical protein MJ082_00520 [Clostridia bacterium]|nr:hypothetical protein [Clostridia bacterium]